MFFNPILRWIRNVTNPVILFLKQNRIMNKEIHPIIPIIILLLLKVILFQSSKGHYLNIKFQDVMLAGIEFISFLFKSYFLMFWLLFSSYKYNFYDDMFNIMATFFNRTLLFVPLARKNISVRNEPIQALSSVSFLFFIAFIVLILGTESSLILNIGASFLYVFSTAFKLMGMGIVYLLNHLPFFMLIRILLSWFMPPMTRPLIILFTITEPVFEPFRRLRLVVGMFDFSPIVAFFVVQLAVSYLSKFFMMFPSV